ncbi:uncharacterized protein LOC129946297 [Eupeodes corollae]|uniref:uncharacterized protein LOC129946297 n=1 Tax=Eupeodes corollae TaxID=290404 RepID=UPI002490E853|nr:uncharacterized protein LOC129946297 [Eupeodes corollae]
MKLMKNSTYYLTVILIVLACCSQETDAVRRVLRGRRTLTRQYYTGLPIPGWALILILAIVELALGAILYFAMRKVILSSSVEHTNTYAPAMTDEV